MRWASTTNDSQKEMKQGQRKWSYVVWDFRLLTSTSTSDQRHSDNFCQRFRLDMGTLGGTPMPVGGQNWQNWQNWLSRFLHHYSSYSYCISIQ
jgi:hypothetical protein